MKNVYYKSAPGDAFIRQIVLLITQSCNLNCTYCYESFKTSSFMSIEVCKKILTSEFQYAVKDSHTSSLAISFLGGEPLLNFELIRAVSEWLWANDWGIPYSLDVRTNGTLLTSEIRKWLVENRERIHVALSLDGLNAAQTISRTDKFIDYKFFIENWPEDRVRIVLVQETLPFFSETINEMVSEKIPISVDIGIGIVWSDDDAITFEKELASLMEVYMNDLQEGKNSGIFPFDVAEFFRKTPEYYSFCAMDDNLVSYDTDGRKYACHMLTPIVIGTGKAEWLNRYGNLIEKIPVDNRCRNCPIYGVCKQCPAMNIKIHNEVAKSASASTFCKMKKVQARACATLFLRHFQMLHAKNAIIDDLIVENAMKSIRLLKAIPEAKYL